MIEEEELDIDPTQGSVDNFVKDFSLECMNTDVMMLLKRLRFKANVMSKKEFEEKENMLKATLISIDNNDLDGISYDKLQEFEEKLGLLPVDEDTKRHGMEATYAERVKAFEDNLDEKNKNAEDFVRKMSAERKERLQKKREKKKKKRQGMEHKRQRDLERKQEEEEKKAEIRKQFEEEIKEKMATHERQRQEMLEKWQKEKEELAKKKYKHIEMEERYNKKVLIPSLERKKEELRKKREYFRPLKHKDFVHHEKAYKQRLKDKLKEKKDKREKWYKDIGYGDYDPKKYQSKYLSSVEREEKKPLYDPFIDVLNQRDKKMNYAKFVKEMHKPKVSESKKKEMKMIIDAVESSGMSRKLGLNNHKSAGVMPKNKPKTQNSSLGDIDVAKSVDRGNSRPNALSKSAMKVRSNIKWNFHNPMIPPPKLKPKGKIIDYLLDRRIKRQEREQDDPDYGYKQKTNWDKFGGSKSVSNHTRSYSEAYDDTSNSFIKPQSRFDKEMEKSEDQVLKQRLELIKTRAKQLEEEAREKEKNMKITSDNSVKTTSTINNMLIDSIEAKLHLLKDI